MSTPGIMRLEANGPGGKGLETWPPIPATDLVAGTPVQRGHTYLDDKAHGLSVGVWDCTAFTAKAGPYSVNEYMILLEGSVTIIDKAGKETVIKAGESFLIPKGLYCQWKQTGYVRKFFVIFDDASGLKPRNPDQLTVLKPDPEVALAPAKGPDPELVVGGKVPTWRDHTLFEDVTGQWTMGVWETTPYERKTITFPRHELMHILTGSVTLTDGEGKAQSFKAGDTLLVEQGARMSWKNSEPVRKLYCIFLPKAAAAKSQAAE